MKRFDIEVVDNCAYLVGNPDGKYVKHEEALETLTALLDVTAQRDQLMAVLELLVDAVGANCDADQNEMAVKPAMKRARATIATVKGGAPC